MLMVCMLDPRILSHAKRLEYVSYEEMMEMSALGAGVLETRSVELAKIMIYHYI